MKEFKFYLPISLNTGEQVKPESFEMVEDSLVDSFGGFSNAGKIQGVWKDSNSGKIYRDINQVYLVASENRENVESFLKSVDSVFQQEAYFLAETSKEITFYNPK